MTDLTRAPIRSALFHTTWPVVLGMLSTFLFQVVDTWFVGRLGTDALSALGFAGALYVLLVGLFMGLSVAVSALLSHTHGRGDLARARQQGTVALGVAAVCAALASGAMRLGSAALLDALGTPAALRPLAQGYLHVLLLAFPLLSLAVVAAAILRATGDARTDALVFGAAGVLNALLDAVLIFGFGSIPAQGFAGAAQATALSWVFLSITLGILLVRRRLLARPARTGVLPELIALLTLTGPAVATQMLLPATAMFLTWRAASISPHVVAAMSVATRIETLALVVITALSVSVVPLVGANAGAGLGGRVAAIQRDTLRLAAAIGAGVFVVLFVLRAPLTTQFTTDPALVPHVTAYFAIVGMSFAGFGILSVSAALFHGQQQPRRALTLLLSKSLLLTVPLAGVGSLWGASAMFWGIAASNLLGAVMALLALRRPMQRRIPRAVRA